MASAFQAYPAFQLAFQQGVTEEKPFLVVLFPGQPLRFKTKADLALYTCAIYAKDCGLGTPLTNLFKQRQRKRYEDVFASTI